MIVNKYQVGGGGSGTQGKQGPQGPQGIEGAQGYQGPAGEPASGAGAADRIIPLGPLTPDTTSWETFVTDVTFAHKVRIEIVNDGSYFAHFNNSNNYVAMDVSDGHITGQSSYATWSGPDADGKYLNEQYGITCWEDDGYVYFDTPNYLFNWLDANNVGGTQQYAKDVYNLSGNTIIATTDGVYQMVSGTPMGIVNENSGRLLPEGAGDNYTLIYASDAWRTQSRGAFTYDGLLGATSYDAGNGDKQVPVRTNQWAWEWQGLDNAHIDAVSALPATSKDGSVYAYANASAYSIVQAQSGLTGYIWTQGEGGMIGWTQMRVPYTSSNSFVAFKTATNEGIGLGWNGYNWDGIQSVDGEFTQEFDGGVIITSVRSGDYLVVTINMPTTESWSEDNVELYMLSVLPNYVNAVMSNDVTKIWKGTAADYAALAPNYDNNTFYIIL